MNPSVTAVVIVLGEQALQAARAAYRADLCLDAAVAIENRRGPITQVDPR